jgi:hypothetical protein
MKDVMLISSYMNPMLQHLHPHSLPPFCSLRSVFPDRANEAQS